eukprot:scaffold119661_cov17-Tisochrysis_lutea.AAC.1
MPKAYCTLKTSRGIQGFLRFCPSIPYPSASSPSSSLVKLAPRASFAPQSSPHVSGNPFCVPQAKQKQVGFTPISLHIQPGDPLGVAAVAVALPVDVWGGASHWRPSPAA